MSFTLAAKGQRAGIVWERLPRAEEEPAGASCWPKPAEVRGEGSPDHPIHWDQVPGHQAKQRWMEKESGQAGQTENHQHGLQGGIIRRG